MCVWWSGRFLSGVCTRPCVHMRSQRFNYNEPMGLDRGHTPASSQQPAGMGGEGGALVLTWVAGMCVWWGRVWLVGMAAAANREGAGCCPNHIARESNRTVRYKVQEEGMGRRAFCLFLFFFSFSVWLLPGGSFLCMYFYPFPHPLHINNHIHQIKSSPPGPTAPQSPSPTPRPSLAHEPPAPRHPWRSSGSIVRG